eukprot:4852653-Amphidinium_carterae.1
MFGDTGSPQGTGGKLYTRPGRTGNNIHQPGRTGLNQEQDNPTSPKKIYKWIRGTAAVWDLAILSDNGYAVSPDQAAQAELEAWSKLWQPGYTTFPQKTTS